MDENLAWKIVYIAAIFSMIVMGIAYYFISPRESPFFTEEKATKIAEFKETRVSGRKEGKKVWEFYAQEGWTSTDREITYLHNIRNGQMYMNGNLVVTKLSAPQAKAYRHSEIVEVFGPPLHAYLELGKISHPEKKDGTEWTRMTAKHLKYIPDAKRSEISGDVELHKKDSSIRAQSISIDHENKIADISEDVRLTRADGDLRARRMRYLSNEEKLEAEEEVKIVIQEGRITTRINSDHASFSTDISRDMTVSGNLEVNQGKKAAVGEKGTYSQKKKELLIQGNVTAIFEKAGVFIRADTAQKLRNPEGQKILEEKTLLASDELILSTESGDARASGAVHVTQKGREARSERAVYDDAKEVLTLTGNVSMKKGEEWVSAQRVVVSVKDESVEAVGRVEAELKL